MTSDLRVAILAEVGHRVGWGHVSRCTLLQRILSRKYCVTLKVVNREPWDDPELAREFALDKRIDADIVFADGLELRAELNDRVRADLVVSLSYMSDINNAADLVVAPALNGMDVPDHFRTELDALLCNRPRTIAASGGEKSHTPIVGICMGGADVEGLSPMLEATLAGAGYQPRTLVRDAGRQRTLSVFLEDKLRGREEDPFPYYPLSGCDLAVCQGGLSAIELALLGVPTIIRSRSDFATAYGFLESLGCSLRSSGEGVSQLMDAVNDLCADGDRRAAMARSCRALASRMCEPFWMALVDQLIKEGVSREAMPLLRG